MGKSCYVLKSMSTKAVLVRSILKSMSTKAVLVRCIELSRIVCFMWQERTIVGVNVQLGYLKAISWQRIERFG